MDSVIGSCGCQAGLHLALSPGAQAAGHARRAVAELLARQPSVCPRTVAEDLLLIVSELVTNAVLHAQGPYALTIGLDPERACIAVSDGTPGLYRHRGARGGLRIKPGGRGLEIVRALGADLVVSHTGLGKQVIAVLIW